jgi:hypothetical protein
MLLDLFDHDAGLIEKSGRTLEGWAAAFEVDLPSQIDDIRWNSQQSHEVEEETSNLEYLAERFGVSIEKEARLLREHADELRREEPYDEDNYEGGDRIRDDGANHERAIDEMFESLR